MIVGKGTAQKIKMAERSSKALTLRKTGASYRSIAAVIASEFGLEKYTEAQAHRDISRELDRIAKDSTLNAVQVRSLELERLDVYLLSIARDVQKGDFLAIDRALKISERRAKLLGIDAPIQLKVQELVTAQIDAEFNLFFEAIQSDSILSPESKSRILEIAQTLGDRAEMAIAN